MHRVFKIPDKGYRTKISIHLFLIMGVCGMLNIHASTLSAEELHAYPGSIVFNAVQGNALNETRSIFIFSAFGTTIGWTQSKNVSWLVPNLQNGETGGVLKIGVNTSGMQAGIYYGNITLQSAQSSSDPVIIQVTLIINPDVPVKITTWKDGYSGAMSVSVDDSQPSGFADLQANGFKGTYMLMSTTQASFFTDYYNAGMELGSHTVNHPCNSVSDMVLRSQELEPNIQGIITSTTEPREDIISFAWPCGYTNYREQSVAAEYFLSARGYNINQLEDATPENFMNLKSFNSHEHTPFPPSDLKTVVDEAISLQKWFNLVLHRYSNDDGAINYAHSKDIWVTSVGTVIKYILQRDRFILTDYNVSSSRITYNISRSQIPSSVSSNFEAAFGPNDLTTMQIDVDDSRNVQNVLINGISNPYQTKDLDGNKVLLTDVKLEASITKTVEIDYDVSSTGLTITGVTAYNKVYDGTTAATLNMGSAALVGVVPGDVVLLVSSSASGTFANKNAGTAKTVYTSGFSLSGPDAGKYHLVQPTTSANITKAALTVTGVEAENKAYDGTTTATLNSGSALFSGVFAGDIVQLVSTNATGIFEDKNVGNGKSVSTTGFTLGGSDRFNYTLIQPYSNADISPAELTISGVTAYDKVYDGSTIATLNTQNALLEGVFESDNVTVVTTYATGTFENENVGTNKTVYANGFTLEGNDSNNYYLTQPITVANITKIVLTISGVMANNKVYNRNTIATLNTGNATLVGVLGADVVTLISTGATGTFVNKNVGTGKSVSTAGFTLGGHDAYKYTVTQPLTTANVTKADINVSGVTANNKVYNGTTAATLNTGSASLSGVFAGDIVTLISTGATGTFVNKNVGTTKLVSTSGFTLGGTDAANYNVTQPSATATITKATVTISGVTTNNKQYDGTISATLNTGSAAIAGVFGSDMVSLVSTNAIGTFANKNAGTAKLVSVSGFSLGGNDATNYTLTQPSSIADILKAQLTVSGITVNNRVYDATISATLNTGSATLVGLLPGDIVTLVSAGASGTFANKNAGIGKVVSTSGFNLAGTDGSNYNLTQPSSVANITKATIAVSGATANNKVYDGTVTATLNSGSASLTGVFGGDIVNLISSTATGTFVNKNAGSGKSVLTSGFSTGGADADNYIITQPSLTASILPKSLTVIANNLNKAYRTTFTFTGTEYTLTGLVPGDVIASITLSSPGASASANVGTYIISVGGGSDSNYTYTYTNGTLAVTKSVLRVKANDKTKVYGSVNPAFTITYTGFINNEDISVLDEIPVASSTVLISSDAGSYPILLTGGRDNNYDIILENGKLQVLKAPLTITADNKTRIYKETNPDLTITYSGFVSGQDESVLDILPKVETLADSDSDAGDYDINISGASDLNYDFNYSKGTLSILKADQNITFADIPVGLRMTQGYQLNAKASSGLDVRFEVSDPNVASLNGNFLKVMKAGNLNVMAIQEGDHNWNPAPEEIQSIVTLPTFDGISSLFTPNNDGMNDYWYIPELEQYGKLQVIVYNRYGQAVYQSDSYKNDWDGTWNGNPLPSASYYYIIKSSTRGFIKGVVNIAR